MDTKLRRSRPLETTSTKASATSAAASTRRVRCCAEPAMARLPSFSAPRRRPREARRREPEEHGAQDRRPQGEAEYLPSTAIIDRRGMSAGPKRVTARPPHTRARRPAPRPCWPAPGSRRGAGAPDASAWRPSAPHADLARPRHRSSQHQAGHVHAGQHQHRQRRAGQDAERGPGATDDLVLEGTARGFQGLGGAGYRVAALARLPQVLFHAARLVAPHAADDVVVVREPVPGMLFARHRERPPDVDRLSVPVGLVRPSDVLEAFRQHTHDAEGPAREAHRAPDRGRIALETAHPQRVAEDHHVGGALELVALLDVASERGRMADQREESGRDPHPAELFRRLSVAELQVAAPVGGDRVERPQLGAVVAEVGGSEREVGSGRSLLEEAHQAVRIRIRQGRDQDPLDRAPDGGVGADGDPQGQDRGGGEPRDRRRSGSNSDVRGPHGR